jgi:hypothetical protein
MSRRAQDQSEARYVAAYESLTPQERAKLKRAGIDGPMLDKSSHAAHAAGDEERDEEVYGVVGAVLPESPLDELCELAGISIAQAGRVMAWHRAQVDAEIKSEISGLLYRVVMYLIRPGIQPRLAHWGMIFAAGLDGLVTGGKSQSDIARACGVQRAKLNWYVGQWRDVLGFAVLKWCRSDSARASYSVRASAVHARRAAVRLDAVGD